MSVIPDDPIISYLERSGFPDDSIPICPICGSECEIIYRDRYTDIIGCNECVESLDASEVEECFRGWNE